ncbi:MAG TPA: DnaJ family domain-containing protein [Anaerolineales bacterium]|nr:DnaJ family domain-containing protein [Anaerolineales bacterium]
MKWGDELEKKIQEALESGAFDNLPGKGEPLSLDQNPHEDPSWRLAFHILKSNEFTLPWLEKRREIEAQISSARAGLHQAWEKQRSSPGGSPPPAVGEWTAAVAAFHRQAAEINRQIRSYNLQAPLDRMHLFAFDAEAEIEALKNSSP